MKIIKSLLLTAILVISLAGCGKTQDTGIIISARDEGNDSSKNELVNTNESTVVNNNKNTNNTEKVVVSDIKVEDEYYIIGTWISDKGDTFGFTNKNTFTNYDVEQAKSLFGTYETDSKSYIILTYPDQYEISINEEGIEILTPLPDIVIEYTIKEFNVSENKIDANMIIVNGDTELSLKRPSSIPANSLEKLQIKVDEKLNAPEQTEEVNKVILTEPIELTNPTLEEGTDNTESIDNSEATEPVTAE